MWTIENSTSEYWFELDSGITQFIFNIGPDSTIGCLDSVHLEIMSGTCSGLTSVQFIYYSHCDTSFTDTISGLNPSLVYYMRIAVPSSSEELFLRAMQSTCPCITLPSNSCELVCNGEFEEYNTHPSASLNFYVSRACPWETIITGDYHNSTLGALPINYTQGPLSGNAMVGIHVNWGVSPYSIQWRENIRQELVSPVEPEDIVFVKFSVLRSTTGEYDIAQLGALLSNSVPPIFDNQQVSTAYIGLTPQVATVYGAGINNQNWTQVDGFVLNSSLQDWNFLTVGNFLDNSVSGNLIPITNGSGASSFAFDNISVLKMPKAVVDQDCVFPDYPFTLSTSDCIIPQGLQIAWYDQASNLLSTSASFMHSESSPGTYIYEMEMTMNGHVISQYVTVVVSDLPPMPVFSSDVLLDCVEDVSLLIWLNYQLYTNGVVVEILNPNGDPVSFTQNGDQIEIYGSIVLGTYIITIDDDDHCPFSFEFIAVPCCEEIEFTVPYHVEVYGSHPPFYEEHFYANFALNNTTATDLIVNYNGSSNVVSGSQFVINGTLYIDQDITFSDCRIMMGPNAKMILENNVKLVFERHTRVFPCGDEMWDGIFANHSSEHIEINEAQFYGAKNAIHLSNYAPFDCSFGYFEQNHTGIVVVDYYIPLTQPPTTPPATNVSIENSYFNHMTNQNLLSPYSFMTQPYAGIHAVRVADLNIGSSSTGSNQFRNSLFGILSENSEIISHANVFLDHFGSFTATNYMRPGGIVAYSTPQFPIMNQVSPKVECVNNSNGNNIFEQNEHGIYGFGIEVDVQDAYFEENEFGILVKDLRIRAIVENNLGVDNDIHIQIERVVPNSPNNIEAKIRFNRLEGGFGGILLTNLVSGSVKQVHVLMDTIVFDQVSGGNRVGIEVNNCQGALVKQNRVTNTLTTPAAAPMQHSGIRVIQTAQAYVTENVITRMSGGIVGGGTLTQTQYTCNDMDNCYNGIYFIDQSNGYTTTIADQRSNTKASDNRWLNHGGGYRMDGGVVMVGGVPYNWYFRGAGGNNTQVYNPQLTVFHSSINLYVPIQEQPNTNNVSECAPIVKSESELREEFLEALSYEEDSTENYYWNAEYSYREQLEFGDANNPDSVYLALESLLDSTNIPAFVEAALLLEEQSYSSALDVLNGISPTHTWEEIRKDAMIIYASEYVHGELSTTSRNLLEGYLDLSPFYYGEGVFYCRLMLDYNSILGANPYKKDNELHLTHQGVIIYPNPSKGHLNIKFESPIQGLVQISFISAIGQLIRKESKEINGTRIELELSSFESGVYVLKIEFNEYTTNYRVIIQQ